MFSWPPALARNDQRDQSAIIPWTMVCSRKLVQTEVPGGDPAAASFPLWVIISATLAFIT